MSRQLRLALLLALALRPACASAQSRVPSSFPDLEQKIAALLPTEEEQAFLQIPWRLNVMQARAESMRTGKPMFVWEMNGHPLGHTWANGLRNRRFTFNNPEIIRRLREQFIPVTSALTDPTFTNSPAGQWFKRTADAHKEPKGHYQGFYILMADGYGPTRLFDYPAWYPAGVLKFMDQGLALVKGHRVSAADIADVDLRAPYIAQPDVTTSVIREFSRMPEAPKSELNSSVDRDHVWIYKDEILEILSKAHDTGSDFPMPAGFAARMARFQLVDDTGGRATVFTGPRQVKRAAFYARATHLDPANARFTFTGSWACGTEDGTIGIEGTIEGEFEVDAAAMRILKFRAYADAKAWGGGSPGHTEMPPPGKFRLVFAFVEANDALSRGVPPSSAFLAGYRDAWNWLTPKAGRWVRMRQRPIAHNANAWRFP
jgi:hypothetical protein